MFLGGSLQSTRISLLTILLALVVGACVRPEPTPTPAVTQRPTPTPTHVPAATPTPTPSITPVSTPGTAPLEEAPLIPTPEEGATPEWQHAVELFNLGYGYQMHGQLMAAIYVYRMSIDVFPTAEAYTFLGWTLSWMGLYDLAIQEAKKAIALDPDYGNPYNDIGAYLMFQRRPNEAIPWLEKAIDAKRYDTPHYSHLNLGRVWVQKRLWDDALAAFEAALQLAPDQPLPSLPTSVKEPPSPPEGTDKPLDEDQYQAVSETMAGYTHAWNSYDPEALLARSMPLSVREAEALLLHLAKAKLMGSQIILVAMEVLHLGDGDAILRTEQEIGGATLTVSYHLAQDEGKWKVIGRVRN